MSASLINYFVKKFARPQSLEKGKNLYFENRVEALVMHEDGKTAEASVSGDSDIYTVIISDFRNMNISAQCSCPYDFGGICKHSVAALYKLIEEISPNEAILNPSINKNIFRKSNSPIQLEGFETLSNPFLNKYTKSLNQNFYFGNIEIQKIHLSNGSLSFVTSDRYSGGYEYITKIYKEDNKYFSYCTCNIKVVNKLCSHESAVVTRLVEVGKRVLQYFEDGKLQQLMHDVCVENDLPETYETEEFMHVEFDKNLIPVILFKGKLQGLISNSTGIDGKNFYELFNNHFRIDKNKIQKLFDKTEVTQMAVGFVFSLFKGKYDEREKVYPIFGKTNAAGSKIVSSISELSVATLSSVKVSDKEREAIILCEQINGIRPFNKLDFERFDDLSDFRKRHEYFKKLIALLHDNPLVYRLKDSTVEIRKMNLEPLNLSTQTIDLEAKLSTDDIFISFIPQLRIGDKLFDIKDVQIKRQSQLIWNQNETLHLVKNISEIEAINFLEDVGTMKAVKQKSGDFLFNIVMPFSERFNLDIDGLKNFETDEIFLKPLHKQVFVSEFQGHILFTPVVVYNHKKEARIMTQGNFVEHAENQIKLYRRDEGYEQEFLEFLRGLHADFLLQEHELAMALPLEEMLINNWFFDSFEAMKEKEIEVLGLQLLKSFKYSPYRATISTGIKSGQDWFDLNLAVTFGDQHIPLSKLKKHILSKDKFIKLGDGTVGMLPEEWVEKLEKYFRIGEIKDDQLLVSKLRFSLIDELFDNIDDTAVLQELAEKKKRLESFTEIAKVRKPAAINATLRDYQKEGLNWLSFLNEMGWGGILADDMGLGKTLQILAFLASLKQKKSTTSLVIVPTTLIFNWENEINKFYPSINALFYYGNNRNKDIEQFKNYQLVITTYGLMVNDIDIFSKMKFGYIILDESQAIKNPLSKRYKAACLLNGKNKLTLTGTPIENNTFDLFAQMTFVNPGMLGTPHSFKDYYSTPIDKEKDPGRANELRKLISPFVLRRTKEQVATELPPKTEDVIYCQMERAQMLVYQEYKDKYRNYLLNKIDEEGLNKNKMYVLEGLMRLRQICNSPSLIGDEEITTEDSIKLDELMRQINEKTGKHKIVVFSQFVKMLRIIETELKREDHNYEYFDGSSTQKQRRESVNRFQNDENCRIFLISLKAGGTGINLTAADYVYIFDPWWNPAVENQAIDRTYRIGQDKKVFAYRMICKDTVEEKILKYQDQKRALAADIIRTDESFVKQLNKEDIQDLFG